VAGVVCKERDLVPEHGHAQGRGHIVHRASTVQVQDDGHSEQGEVPREFPGVVDIIGLKETLCPKPGLELAVGGRDLDRLSSKNIVLGAVGLGNDRRKFGVGLTGEVVCNLKVLDLLFEDVVWVKGLDLVGAVATDAVADGKLSTGMMLDPLVELVDLLVDDDENFTRLASGLELRTRDDVLLGHRLDVC